MKHEYDPATFDFPEQRAKRICDAWCAGKITDAEEAIRHEIRAAENAAYEAAARVADQPYNDKVQGLAGESILTVARKIGDAIRSLKTRAPRRKPDVE